MAKELHEISKFMTGTVTTPSERDISDDAASESLNIDPITEDGVLQGIYADKTVTTKLDTDSSGSLDPIPCNTQKMSYLTSAGEKELVFFDAADNKIKTIHSLSNSNINVVDVSSSAESVTGIPDFEPNNQEIHIGAGTGINDVPLWAGKITNKQFGSAIAGTKRELAKLTRPGNMPPFDKVIKVGNYFIGMQDNDTKLYSFNPSDGKFFNSSSDNFQDLRAIAYNDETSLWVLDKISTSTAEIKLVDATTFEVKQTSSFDKIYAAGTVSWDSILNGQPPRAFSSYFGSTLGGGADFITDMVCTNGYLWFIRGGGQSHNIKWRFLFKAKIPYQTGTMIVYDVSFRLIHENDSGGSGSANGDGIFYKSATAGSTDDITVKAMIPYKGLVDAGVGCGVLISFKSQDSGSNKRVYLYNSYVADIVEDGTSLEGKATALGSDEDDSHNWSHIFYFGDDYYYPHHGTNPVGVSGTLTGGYTHNPLDSYDTVNGTRYTKYKIFKPTAYPSDNFDNVVGLEGSGVFPYRRAVNISYQDASVSTNRLSISFMENSTTCYGYVQATGSAYIPLYSSNNANWDNKDVKQAVQISTSIGTGIEMRNSFIYSDYSNSATNTYFFRGSKNFSEKKLQIAKVSNGSISYFTEADIAVSFAEVGTDGIWDSSGVSGASNAAKVFYKFSLTYDGYQESPLGNAFIHIFSLDTNDNPIQSRIRLTVKLNNISSLSNRATHLNIYSAVSSSATASGPDGFYRLFDSLRLDSGWTDGTSDEDSSLAPAWGATKSRELVHKGKVSSSYEARTGINEQVDDTMPHYSISTALNNQLFIANCYHFRIDDASNYLFKSKPYNFSQFDWITDFLLLPTTPTALKSFMGRVYAFDEDSMYRIEPNNLYIEDTIDGIGCTNHKTIVVSEYGMCFCNEENIYLHDGKQAVPIGDTILRNSINSWESKTEIITVSFDSFKKAFLIFFRNSNGDYKTWAYSVLRRRWDLWDAPSGIKEAIMVPNKTVSYITQHGQAAALTSNGTNLVTYQGDSTKRSWDWISKKIHMGQNTNDKKFYKIKLVGTPSGSLGNASTGVYGQIDGADFVESGSTSEFKVPGSSNKGKQMQVFLKGQTGSVDAIGIVFRRLKVK